MLEKNAPVSARKSANTSALPEGFIQNATSTNTRNTVALSFLVVSRVIGASVGDVAQGGATARGLHPPG